MKVSRKFMSGKFRVRLSWTLCVIFMQQKLCPLRLNFPTTIDILGRGQDLSRTGTKLQRNFGDDISPSNKILVDWNEGPQVVKHQNAKLFILRYLIIYQEILSYVLPTEIFYEYVIDSGIFYYLFLAKNTELFRGVYMY